MRILYITSVPLEYSSSANMRNIALIKGLIKNGHEVCTLSTEPQNTSAYYDKSILNLDLQNRYYIKLGQLHSLMTTKTRRKKRSIKGILYKLYNYFNIYDPRKNEVKYINNVDLSGERFDIIISSSDPKSSHLYAQRLIQLNPGICDRWIQYWGDPFTNDINKKNLVPNFVIAKEEKRLLKLCDKAVYVSPMTTDYIKSKYKELAGKICFLPVGYDNKRYYPETHSEKTRLCYCGDYFSKDRDILPLIDAVGKLGEECSLTIAGNSDLKLDTCDNIEVLPRVNKEKVEMIESDSNVIVCICNKHGTQIPGKIYHSSGTNRRVLVILDGDKKDTIKDYFSKYGRFEFCENRSEEIYKMLKTGNNLTSRIEPCEEFCGEKIAEEFVK